MYKSRLYRLPLFKSLTSRGLTNITKKSFQNKTGTANIFFKVIT